MNFSEWGHDEVKLLLTKPAEWHERRRNGIGGSDATILMNGSPEDIAGLYAVKRGEVDDVDLSDVLPVIMGTMTEPLNRYWYTLQTGRGVSNIAAVSTCRNHPFMQASLDGITQTEDSRAAVFEAKTVNAFSKIEEVEQRYMPQLHHNMLCAGVNRAILSVFIGTLKWGYAEIELDDWYAAQLIDRETAFWESVQSGTPPPFCEPIKAPVVPREQMRTVDMTGSNTWSAAADDWLLHFGAAKSHAKAVKDLKELVEADVREATGYGVAVKRSKNNALTVRIAK